MEEPPLLRRMTGELTIASYYLDRVLESSGNLTKLPVQGSKRIIPLGQLAFVIVGGEKVAGERRDDR